jgi:hypothetical protein
MHLLSPGQVAQSVERAAENRKVGGSIPSLPTTSAQVSELLARTPPLDELAIATSLRRSPDSLHNGRFAPRGSGACWDGHGLGNQ